MKKIIALSTVAFLSTALYANADLEAQIAELTTKVEKLEKKQVKNTKKIGRVNALAAKDNIKWDVDFRTAYDNIQYETANGAEYKNDALYSMRLRLGMGYAPADDLVFKGKLSMNKAFGASYMQRATGQGFDTFDWVINEQLTDDTLRVNEAYWLWTPTVGDIGYTLSVGRRPATNGSLINLRDDDKEASPMGHVINMEFDGASASVKLDKYIPGFSFKLCLGRGLTNATSWASEATAALGGAGGTNLPNYVDDGNSLDNTDMAGFIIVPYDDGQYQVKATWFRGFNVPGLFASEIDGATGAPISYQMMSAGDMDGGAISFKVEGIGDEINDFLDNTILFASYAYSKSHPDSITRMIDTNGDGIGDMAMTASSMIGSSESETGTSFWLGAQMPNLTGGKFGLEYNHGSENWRPFTYGEDTMIGSKMATRGNAYEAYWTQPIVDKALTMQIRYTYIDYEYTGSNGFFGDGSTAMTMAEATAMGMDPVETAQDIRVYFRYRY
jgi:hypothetical protein